MFVAISWSQMRKELKLESIKRSVFMQEICQYSHKHFLKCVPSICKRGFIVKKVIRFSFGALEDIANSISAG